ncbi:MAG: hypothetical protein A2Z42_05085 [Candidatus Woykebacteria bacterium RBG_19FT_COMBO_43_10]|uniref:Phosphoribosyltransferase domain-containing protein n=1 Tax=Candidatus Woykebacteria bacterium RBG_19FT_COMBO_43_10 TaxID=1802598 RepID=A0A1G1WI88_9BACT|nr:MAG: hypothetical protein A2Z42_05085 [Candidatus Woykebacteria bacterium RBG_19FT_COMBO_43_10]
MGFLDLIFPKRCVVCGRFGEYLCEEDKKKIQPAKAFCPVCLRAAISGATHPKCKGKLSLDGLICLVDYKSPVKEIIAELKYRFVTDLARILEQEIRKPHFLDKYDFAGFTMVPIPLSSGKKNWRGFNQAEILARVVARRWKLPFDPEVLQKIRETKPQAKLRRDERLKQVKRTFGLVSETVKGKKYIIFDDVWTTGATLKAAATALKRKGAATVWGMTLASSH